MKKILLAAGAISLFAGAAETQAAAFNGWSLGGFFGWHRTKTEGEISALNHKKNLETNGFPVGLFLNWSKSVPGSLYGAAEFGVGYGGSRSSKTFFSGPSPLGGGTGQGEVNYKQTRKFFVEFTPKLGWNFGNQVAYLFISLRGTQLQHDFNVVKDLKVGAATYQKAGDDVRGKDFALSIAPGLGVEHKITDHFTAGFEYRCLFEKSKETRGFSSKVDTTSRAHDVRIRVAYAF